MVAFELPAVAEEEGAEASSSKQQQDSNPFARFSERVCQCGKLHDGVLASVMEYTGMLKKML
jgi:hypothetical protein